MKEKLMMEKIIEEVQNTNKNTNDITKILDPPTSKCKGAQEIDTSLFRKWLKKAKESTLSTENDQDTKAKNLTKRTRTYSKCGTQGHDVHTCKG